MIHADKTMNLKKEEVSKMAGGGLHEKIRVRLRFNEGSVKKIAIGLKQKTEKREERQESEAQSAFKRTFNKVKDRLNLEFEKGGRVIGSNAKTKSTNFRTPQSPVSGDKRGYPKTTSSFKVEDTEDDQLKISDVFYLTESKPLHKTERKRSWKPVMRKVESFCDLDEVHPDTACYEEPVGELVKAELELSKRKSQRENFKIRAENIIEEAVRAESNAKDLFAQLKIAKNPYFSISSSLSKPKMTREQMERRMMKNKLKDFIEKYQNNK